MSKERKEAMQAALCTAGLIVTMVFTNLLMMSIGA